MLRLISGQKIFPVFFTIPIDMLVLQIVMYALGFLAIVLTVLPFLKFDAWWIRIGEFPRLQIAFLCCLVGAYFVYFEEFLQLFEVFFLIFLAGCAIYQLFRILPYTPLYAKQVQKALEPIAENTIKMLIYNVFIKNRDTGRLIKVINELKPDLVLLAEPDKRWLDEIEEIEKKYVYRVKCPLDNTYGLALYSRFELIDPKLKFLIEDDIPSIHTGVKLDSGEVVRLYCLHPRPPIPPENDRSTERDVELILVGKMIAETDTPTIVAGDLNDVAWSQTTRLFQKISGLLDPRIGRGLYSSFHAKHFLVRFPLDHVFHTNHFRLIGLKRLKKIGSDHFPIFIQLNYEKTAEIMQEEPKPAAEEKREAEEILNQKL